MTNTLTSSDRTIDNVCIHAINAEGELLAKNIGLTEVTKHEDKGKIFLGSYSDIMTSAKVRQIQRMAL